MTDAPVVRRATVAEIRPLRSAVLRPGLPADAVVWPGDDDAASVHLAAFAADAVVGVVTLIRSDYPATGEPGHQLRGMAVEPAWRGRGVGGLLVDALMAQAVALGSPLVWCNARMVAERFYARHGFITDGGVFTLPPYDIPHVRMRRAVGDHR